DVMQEVLGATAKGTYDRRKGPFHKWLLTVTLNEIRDFFTRRGRQAQLVGDTALRNVPAEEPAGVEAEWDEAHKQRLFARAAELVRATVSAGHWRAFWQTAVEGRAGKDVARTLGMSVANVYSVKSRILAQIKEVIQQLKED